MALTLNVPSLLCYCYAAGSAYVTRSDTHSVITLRGEHTLGTQLGGAPIRILLRYPGEYGAWFVEFHGERTGENTLTGYIRVVSPKSLASEILGADSVAFAFKRQ